MLQMQKMLNVMLMWCCGHVRNHRFNQTDLNRAEVLIVCMCICMFIAWMHGKWMTNSNLAQAQEEESIIQTVMVCVFQGIMEFLR